MGVIDELRAASVSGRQLEEALYAEALREAMSGNVRPGIWAKAIANAQGDPGRTQAEYLKLRVQSMRDEMALVDQGIRAATAVSRASQREKRRSLFDRPLNLIILAIAVAVLGVLFVVHRVTNLPLWALGIAFGVIMGVAGKLVPDGDE